MKSITRRTMAEDEETFINPVSVISSFLFAIGIVGLIAMKLYQMNLFE